MGGFVGQDFSGTYTADFWNSTINPSLNSSGGGALTGVTGETTTQMQTLNIYSGWNFTNTWTIRHLLSDVNERRGSYGLAPATGQWPPTGATACQRLQLPSSLTAPAHQIQPSIPISPASWAHINISSGYTGTITQSANLTVNGALLKPAAAPSPRILLIILPSVEASQFPMYDQGFFTRYTGSGTSGSPYLIYDVYGLQGMEDNLTNNAIYLI